MGIGYRARARAPIFHLLFVITGAATIDWIFTPSEDVPSVDGQLTVARAFRDMSCYSYTAPTNLQSHCSPTWERIGRIWVPATWG
ncbi:uncharacterized protein [Triticum aestivum]|uniref:uncharacterized protein isoform X2 n=1 Tax=Triticum aestivum TaxID=4565 RepID=UPI001D026379|nr:uncharacterized protein LOC123059940 isoform X2 [Triticum aestivum]